MGHRIARAEQFPARFRRSPCAAQLVPRLLRQCQVEIGQDHRAIGQVCNRPQHACKRGRRAGDAGGDDRRCRRFAAPLLGRPVKQHVAPRGRIDLAALLQTVPPALFDPGEQSQGPFPMLRQVAKDIQHRIAQQVLRSDILDQKAVHRACNLAGQPQPRGPWQRLFAQRGALDLDQPGQFEPAPRRFYRRGNVARAKGIEQCAQRLVEIEIADGHHARHQQPRHPRLAAMADESLRNGARCATARNQQRQARQPQIAVGIARHDSGNEGIGKAAMRRDGVDRWRARLSHASAHLRLARWRLACPPRTTNR